MVPGMHLQAPSTAPSCIAGASDLLLLPFFLSVVCFLNGLQGIAESEGEIPLLLSTFWTKENSSFVSLCFQGITGNVFTVSWKSATLTRAAPILAAVRMLYCTQKSRYNVVHMKCI